MEDSWPMLEVRLAGGLTLRTEAGDITPPGSKRARAVLAYLALHPGAHARGRLAARFWPDVLDESARASLRVALTELRQALGPEAAVVHATRETVALEGPGLLVDTRSFHQALADGDPVRALAACRTPILDGFDDEWALQARDEHAQRLGEALEQAAMLAGDPEEAIRLTRSQVALDPLAEAANRRLIERLAATGDRAAAISAGRQFTERLRAQLGIAPSPETRALLAELRRAEPPAVPPPAGLTGADEADFVGRGVELERLRASWGGVQMHRNRRIVLVAGEPGVGKTRLAHQFAAAALAGGAIVLEGRCSEEPLAPFEPFSEALGHAGAAEILQPGHGDDAGARHRLLDAVDDMLSGLASRAPLLLVIDDFHWADRGTLLLTSFLLRSSRPGPMLVLGTYRDTELGRQTPLTSALVELTRSGTLDRITLRGLPLGDVATLARSVLGNDEVAPRVHARTDGNAFFVEEVLRAMAETGPHLVPESVRQAIGVRLSGMGEGANRLIAAAAILGLEHDTRALPATAGLESDAAEAALDEILRARLLRPAATPHRLVFTHALVREAVLEECNVLQRARLHRRAAEALTALGEDRHLEEIAMHLFEAASTGDARQAADMLVRAGRRALDRLAYEDAAERFERALEALGLADADDESGPVMLARGDALLRAGEADAARAMFTAARELALRRDDHALLARAALGFAGLGIAIVDLDAGTIARLEEALDRVKDRPLRSRVQARLAVELYYATDRTRSEALSAEAVASAQAARDASALASALGARHVTLWRPDRVEERLAVAGDMIAAARDAGDRHAELQGHNWRVTDLFELGDTAGWEEETARHARLAEELRLPVFEWYTPLWASVRAMLGGRFDDAERLSAEAEEAGLRAGDRNATLFVGLVRFCAQVEREAFDDIDMAFVEDKIANSPAGVAYRGGYTWILAGRGETERARDQLRTVMALPHAFDANWLSLQAECAEASILVNDATHAGTLYERLVPYAGRPVTAGRSVCSYGAADRFLGGLAALLGRRDDARRHLEDAIRINAALGCSVWREHTERHLARIVLASDEEGQATGSGAVSLDGRDGGDGDRPGR
jgi:DNA-binding SARP family transcriptional activator/tetratricopeptide (TPR) repeat protein